MTDDNKPSIEAVEKIRTILRIKEICSKESKQATFRETISVLMTLRLLVPFWGIICVKISYITGLEQFNNQAVIRLHLVFISYSKLAGITPTPYSQALIVRLLNRISDKRKRG